MSKSFLFFDLETFGRDPRGSRIAQFAAIRTDEDLNEIGDAVSLFCQPAGDLLPSPTATLITGITPQFAQANGMNEAEFFAALMEEFGQPGTCALGYNSIRFDDEFIRYGLYRNFFEPYEREYANGNSRWDLLDVMRMACALRPDGIEWPKREDGAHSFKLEDLAQANGLRIGDAHEALSDVRALLGLARQLKLAQPKLWDYCLQLRDKRKVLAHLDVVGQQPILHFSGRFPAQRHCAALMMPLVAHPRISNRVVCVDLSADPGAWLDLDAESLRQRVFTREADLPEGVTRVPLKEIHANRCPIVLPLSHLREADFQRLGIDREQCLLHWQRIREAKGLGGRIAAIFEEDRDFGPSDVDGALYSGFIGPRSKSLLSQVRSSAPERMADFAGRFDDERYAQLLFRYRARNWPERLSFAEREQWDAFRRERLQQGAHGSEYSFASFRAEIDALRGQADVMQGALLDALQDWAAALEDELSDGITDNPETGS